MSLTEKEKVVSEMDNDCISQGAVFLWENYEALYDSGWRKKMSREDAEKILCSIASDRNNGDLRFSVRQLILNELGFKD